MFTITLMAMAPRRAYEVGISVLLVLAFSARANAHCEVGNRVFTALDVSNEFRLLYSRLR